MTTRNDMHLNEFQILQAVVDEADLPSTLRKHVAECRLCRAEKMRLEARLARMKQVAAELTPRPVRRPMLNLDEPRSSQWLPRGWKYGLSAGLAVAAMMIITFGSLFLRPTTEDMAFLTDRETMEDEQFMAEIARLEEDGFPALYLEISGSADESAGEDTLDDVSFKETEMNETDAPSLGNGRISYDWEEGAHHV